jgi:hypothetical protein
MILRGAIPDRGREDFAVQAFCIVTIHRSLARVGEKQYEASNAQTQGEGSSN